MPLFDAQEAGARCDGQSLQAKCGIGAGGLFSFGFFHALGTSFEIPNALCSLVSCLLFLSSLGVALAIASRRCVPAFWTASRFLGRIWFSPATLCAGWPEKLGLGRVSSMCVCVSHVGLLTCRVWQYIIPSDSGLLVLL